MKGDEILRAVSDTIKLVSRCEDSAFRYGGDEFCVILPNCTEEHAKTIYSTRFAEELKQYPENVSVSIGIIQTGPESFLDADNLIQQADHRMYVEKTKMKLTVVGK
jgi:diguanylate cyclase